MQSKLPNIGTSIFTVMSQLAAKHNAINLGQGFPDFPMSAELIECVNKAMQSGGNQYAHTNGVPLLRERLAEKIKYLYAITISQRYFNMCILFLKICDHKYFFMASNGIQKRKDHFRKLLL